MQRDTRMYRRYWHKSTMALPDTPFDSIFSFSSWWWTAKSRAIYPIDRHIGFTFRADPGNEKPVSHGNTESWVPHQLLKSAFTFRLQSLLASITATGESLRGFLCVFHMAKSHQTQRHWSRPRSYVPTAGFCDSR